MLKQKSKSITQLLHQTSCQLFLLAAGLSLATLLIIPQKAHAATIADKNAAATFCQEKLPDGSANVSRDYCAFTPPGASSRCVVSSSGSFPVFSETCHTFSLTSMVGQDDADLVALANSGGGSPTSPGASGPGGNTTLPTAGNETDCKDADLSKDCQVVEYLIVIINVLSGLVGVVIVGSIIVGGIQYTSAADDPQKISAAKSRIYSAVLAFVVFIFFYAFLQWVVPGGVLN